MAQRTLTITDGEAHVLKLVLSVDLDALGLTGRGHQSMARSVLRKLRTADAADLKDRLTGGDTGPKPVKAIGAAGLQARLSGRVLPS